MLLGIIIEIGSNMARDIFGNRKITNADVRMEYVKALCWFVLGYLYFHFVIMGW